MFKKMVLATAALSGIIMMSACSSVTAPRGIKNVSSQGILNAGKSVYVPVGPNGKYFTFPMLARKDAAGSGEDAADVVFALTSAYQSRIVKGVQMETEEQALATARSKGLDYVLYSRVNTWADANYLTCTYNYIDSVEIDLSAYEVATGKVMRLDKLYSGGCPIKVFGIPFGASTPQAHFRAILTIWLSENFSERR